MTFLQLQTELARMLGEMSSSKFWPTADLKSFINEAYAIIASRSDIIETSSTLSITANTWLYSLNSSCYSITRAYYSTVGTLIIPTSFERLSSYDPFWLTTYGSYPTHYVAINPHQIFLYPAQTAAEVNAITYNYIRLPTALSANGDIPEIITQYQKSLLSFAKAIAMLRERTPTSKIIATRTYQKLISELKDMADDVNNIANNLDQIEEFAL